MDNSKPTNNMGGIASTNNKSASHIDTKHVNKQEDNNLDGGGGATSHKNETI